MRIWFDLSNSPHINMFYGLIKELEAEGHEIIITCRPLANTIDLLKQKKLNYTVVGEHYGKSIMKKLFGYPIRVWQLRSFLSKNKPDIAVSQSSFHSPIVAWMLGIPSIYTNDNEHALGNIPSFIFATQVLIPESLPIDRVVKKGASRKKVMHYPGVKEGIYLWEKGEEIHKKRAESGPKETKVYVRPEPLTAQYYKGGLNFLDETLELVQDKVETIILARDRTQLEHYRQQKFSGLTVPEKPLEFDQIAEDCTLFVGAGGSMTREMAILGIPTVSVYQDDLLEVDKYLIDEKIMLHKPNLTKDDVMDLLKSISDKQPDLELMKKGKEAYNLLKSNILKYAKK